MPVTPIHVPRLGEGVMEARLVRFFRQSGERVLRDEPLLEVETDKAVYVIEAPEEGVVENWTAEEGAVLPIGSLIVTIRSDNGETACAPPPPSPQRNSDLSPRVRTWCREHGVTEETIAAVRALHGTRALQISDFEQWLAGEMVERYRDSTVSARKRALNASLAHGWRNSVPSWVEAHCAWDPLTSARRSLSVDGRRVASIELLAWTAIRAMRQHPALRSTLLDDNTIREHREAVLGIAVALPDDELVTAPAADREDFADFVRDLRGSIQRAQSGGFAPGPPQLLLSYMAPFGLTSASPTVVPPAVATLFVGAPFEVPSRGEDGGIAWERKVSLVLGFEHRVLNGAGAARFLKELKRMIEQPMP